MSQNHNGKNAPQRKPYQTAKSPYRLENSGWGTEAHDHSSTAKTGERAALGNPSHNKKKSRKSKRHNKEPEFFSLNDPRDVDPKHKILKDLQEGERVVKFYRRSKWHLLYLGLFPLIFSVLVVLLLIATIFIPPAGILALPALIIVALWWTWTVVDWTNDYLIITNRRIVQIEKIILAEQTRQEIRSSELAEVKLVTNRNPIEYSFNIGSVTIQGKNGTIVFDHVSNPKKVWQEIDKYSKDYRFARRKERDTYLDRYFIAKIHGAPPPRPPYSRDIPHHTEEVGFFTKILQSKPIFSMDEMKRQQFIWHKHFFILFKLEFIPVSLSLVYIILLILFLPPLLLLGGLFAIFILPVVIAIAFGLFVFLWYRYEEWNNDLYVLNTEEIMDSEKKPFGFDEFKERIKLANIQQVSYEKKGPVANIFNYGSVMIGRIGGNKPLTFYSVPNPEMIQQQIERWVRTRGEIIESMDDERTVDFLVRQQPNLHQMLEKGVDNTGAG